MLNSDVIVIGSGPAGMTAALYLKRAGINVLIIDKDAPGGQMLKTNNIENYMGFSSINGADLSLKMFEQVKNLDIPFEFGKVALVYKENKFFKVKINDKIFKCKYVIVATGRTPNRLKLPNESEVKGISYCAVCDGTFYKNKVVGVVGGGNSAITNALYLADLCKLVYVFVREDIKAESTLVTKAYNKDNIVIVKGEEVKDLILDDDTLKGVKLSSSKIINLNGLFIAIGSHPATSFVDVKKVNNYIVVNDKMETSVKGIYAAGDVIYKNFYQIALAIGEGATAALAIKEEI